MGRPVGIRNAFGRRKEKALTAYKETMGGWDEEIFELPGEEKRIGISNRSRGDGRIYRLVRQLSDRRGLQHFRRRGKCAVGIDIPAVAARGKGYAFAALKLFIGYLLENGERGIYTQTWSGNVRMIGLAEKLGFEEYRRKKGLRTVAGKPYDGLTFRLNEEKFRALSRG